MTELSEAIAVALIAGGMSCIASVVSVVMANRLMGYRIDQLEKKMDKHNHLVERMAIVEQSAKSAHHRIDEIKEEIP